LKILFFGKKIIFTRILNEFRYYYNLPQRLLNCNTLYKIGMHYSLSKDDRPRTIGLTGGIGTGKTTVSDYLASYYGLIILDADRYARDAVAPDSQGLRAIVNRYGPEMLRLDKTLDRPRLAEMMFQSATEKRWLEGLIHPFVRDRLIATAQSLHHQPVIVMDIPLLFEAQMTDLVSEIWVVYCRPDLQLSRLMARDRLTEQAAQRRIESQMPLAQKCDRADVVLDNSGSVNALYAQVDRALFLGNVATDQIPLNPP
jgi:dephospho-CoA kinase